MIMNMTRDRYFWIGSCVILFVTFVVYIPVLGGDFIWDDDTYVSNNPLLMASDGLWRIWKGGETVQYYPMVFTTFWIEQRLWGLDATGYHAVNVALHSFNALLFWLLLRRLDIKWAWFAGAVFALHPVHVESVAWITERKNVLSGLFYLLAAGSYFNFLSRSSWVWYGASLLFFLLALFSKTVTCSLPVALLLIIWLQRGRVSLKDVYFLIPFVLVGLVMGLVTIWYEVNIAGTEGVEWDLSFLQRLMIAGNALWFYVMKLLWPVKLTFIYPRWQLDTSNVVQWIFPVGTVIVAFWLWWIRDRVGKGPIVGVAFFSVTLLPALGFVNVYPMRYSFVADHFQYLASMGMIALFAGGMAWGFNRWSGTTLGMNSRRNVRNGLGIGVLLVLGILTYKQGYVYRDLETLWKDTIVKNPSAWMAHTNLGLIYFEQEKWEEAIKAYRRTLQLSPGHAKVHSNLGVAYFKQGNKEAAIREQLNALKIDPQYSEAHINLGNIYFEQKEFFLAIQEYEEAIKLQPQSILAHYNLGRVYEVTGKVDLAIEQYRRIVDNAPFQHHKIVGNAKKRLKYLMQKVSQR